jgi:hypothetical protein
MDDQINLEKTFNQRITASGNDFKTMIHLYDSDDYH